jgi:hypothetical protein
VEAEMAHTAEYRKRGPTLTGSMSENSWRKERVRRVQKMVAVTRSLACAAEGSSGSGACGRGAYRLSAIHQTVAE